MLSPKNLLAYLDGVGVGDEVVPTAIGEGVVSRQVEHGEGVGREATSKDILLPLTGRVHLDKEG